MKPIVPLIFLVAALGGALAMVADTGAGTGGVPAKKPQQQQQQQQNKPAVAHPTAKPAVHTTAAKPAGHQAPAAQPPKAHPAPQQQHHQQQPAAQQQAHPKQDHHAAPADGHQKHGGDNGAAPGANHHRGLPHMGAKPQTQGHLIHKPAPVIAVFGPAKAAVFKEKRPGQFTIVRANLALKSRGRFVSRGYGWTRGCKGLVLPPWAHKAVIILPFGSRRPVFQRGGTIKTGAKIYHVVRIAQVQSPEQLEKLAHHLLEFLVQRKVINVQVGANIANTFGVKTSGPLATRPKQLLQAKGCKTMTVKGYLKARNRFIKNVRTLIARRDPQPSKVRTLVKILWHLVLDNEHLRVPAAIEVSNRFGVRIQVLARSNGVVFIHKLGVSRFISVVQNIRGTPEQLNTFANHLTGIVVQRRLFDVELAQRLLATFAVTGQGNLAGKHTPFAAADLKGLSIRGRPLPRRRFLHDLNELLTNNNGARPAVERHQQAIRLLIQLIIGNGIRRAKQFEAVARKKFGVSFTIQRTMPNFNSQPWLRPSKPQRPAPVHSLVYFHKVFHQEQIPKDKAHTYIRKLLELLVEKNVVELSVARTLLATFAIHAPGKFAPSADTKPWTPQTMNTFKVAGNHFAKGNFLNIILQLVLDKQKPSADDTVDVLSRSLLELVLDNDVINIRNATDLANATGIKVLCRKLPAPPPKPEEVADKSDSKENEEDDEEEEGEKEVEGGFLLGNKPVGPPPVRATTPSATHDDDDNGHDEDKGEDEASSESSSDSDESKSGDSSNSSEEGGRAAKTTTKPAAPKAPEDEDDDDEDDNVKPEKVVNSVVTFEKTSADKRIPFILHVLTLLCDKDLIEKEAVGSILTTFAIKSDQFPKGPQITEDNADDLEIDGTDEAKEKLHATVLQLINTKDQPDRVDVLLKVLLEFAIDNKCILKADIDQIAQSFGYKLSTEIRKVKAELEHNINLGQQASFGTKYLSEVEIEDCTQDHLPFADNILASVVDNSLIDAPTAVNLLTTFGYTGASRFGEIKQGQKIDKVANVQVVSDPDSKKKFTENLGKLLSAAKVRQVGLIDCVLELALDNAVIDIHAAAKLAVQYGYSISIKVRKIVSQPAVPAAAGSKCRSDVTITGSFAEDLSPFLNQLAGELAAAKLLDAAVSNSIFATFGVTGAGAKKIPADEISKIDIKGDADAKTRCLASLKSLSEKAATGGEIDATVILKTYLELLLDNKAIPAQDAAQLAVSHGVSCSIQERYLAKKA